MPINNETLVQRSIALQEVAISTSATYDLLRNLSNLKSIFKSKISNPQQENRSRLLRSIAASHIPGASRDSTHGVHNVLVAIHEAVSKTLVTCLQGNVTIDHSVAIWFKTILQFWMNILNMVSSEDFDQAMFQALLQVGTSKIIRPAGTDSMIELHDVVRRSINKLKGSNTLSTGRAMELLWRAFKPAQGAASFEALQVLLRLEYLADEFDRASLISMSNSLTDTMKIRDSFAKAFTLVLGNQTVNLDTLRTSLEILPELDLGPTGNPTEPFFSDEFEALCQIQNLNRKTASAIPALFAQRATRSMGESQESSKLAALNGYLGYFRSKLPIAFALRGDLPSSLIKKTSQHIIEVSLKETELLEYEVDLMGQVLANDTVAYGRNQLQSLDDLLASLVRAMMRALGSPQEIDIHVIARKSSGKVGDFVQSDFPWRDIFNNQFRDVFDYFGSETHSNPTSAASNAWIQFGIGCLLMYVPDKPYDPALMPIVERNLWREHTGDLKEQIDALRAFELGFTGASTSMRIRLTEDELALQGPEPYVPAIARPPQSELGTLHAEFANVLQLVDSLLSRGIGASVDPTIQENLSQLIRRLSDGHRAYYDLTAPLVGFLQCVQVGALLSEQRNRMSGGGNSPADWIISITPLVARTPNLVLAALDPAAAEHLTVRMHSLEVLAIHHSISGHLSNAYELKISSCFDRFFREWKEHLQSDQAKDIAKSSLYTYRGGDDEDDDFDQDEFEDLFPDYEASEPSQQPKPKSYEPQVTARELADVHGALFLGSSDQSLGLQSLLEKTAARISRISTKNIPISMANGLPTIFLMLSQQKDALGAVDTRENSNFYTSTNIVEAKKLITLINVTQRRFAQIHKAWPEQATPLEVLRFCRETLEFRHVEPVAKFITKVEKLHATVNEWQAIASKEWSAEAVYTDLTSLIISWRQMELKTWATMLDAENAKLADAAKMWWFVAYENLIVNPTILFESDDDELDLGDHARRLLKILEEFLISTTMGQYEARIRLMQQFQAHLAFLTTTNAELQPVHEALSNFINYFSRFVEPIRRTIADRRKPLEEQITDAIKIASWKDRNVNALRASSKLSHRKLFKVVRKYRAILNEPVEKILRAGLQDDFSCTEQGHITSTFGTGATGLSMGDSSASAACELEFPDLPVRFKNISATISMMQSKGTAGPLLDAAAYLDSFTSDTQASISQLHKATPTALTEENKDTHKYLKSRKRRLFADVLKELRQMGFKSSLSTDVLAEQDSRHKVLASTPPLPFEAESKMQPSQFHFYKLLELMPKIRETTREHSEDVTSAEIARSTAYIEDLLRASMRQRQAIAESLHDHSALTRVCDQAAILWRDGACAVEEGQTVPAANHNLQQSIKWLAAIIDVALKVTRAQEKLGALNFSDVRDDLAEWRSSFLKISTALGEDPSTPHQLRSSSYTKIESTASDRFVLFEGYLSDLSRNQPQLAYLSDLIRPWINSNWDLLGSQGVNNDSQASAPAIEEITSNCDNILVAVQDLEKTLDSIQPSSEDTQWLLKAEDALESCISDLNAASIVPEWQQLLDSLYLLEEDDLGRSAALIAHLLPIVQQYRQIYQKALERFIALHEATCRMSYVLATSFAQIATQGFCTPAEKSSGQAEQTEKIEEGTGLGDGDAMEGAEDISKDIEGDEDLEELAQQQADKQDGEDIEDEKDAVDMADEMEGQTEQVDRSDDDGEDRDEAEDGSQDDVDSEVGSVDDLGASAVDEKMWDEAAEKDAEDREADDKGVGSKEKNEQVASKDQEHSDQDLDEEMDDMKGENAEASTRQPPEEAELEHPNQEENLDLPEDLQIGQNGDDDGLSSDSEAGTDFGDRDDGAQEVDEEGAMDLDHDNNQEEDASSENEASSDVNEDSDPNAKANTPNDEDEAENRKPPFENFSINEELADFALDPTDEHPPTNGNQENAAGTDDPAQTNEIGNAGESEENPSHEETTAGSAGQEGTDAPEDQQDASGRTGQLGQPPDQESVPQVSEPRDGSHENQPFKKLGDALEQWYRQQRNIQESNGETQKIPESFGPDAEMRDAEFQHLEDNEDVPDVQAIGTATEDEATALDTSMAIETLEHDELPNRPFDATEEQDIEAGAEMQVDRAESAEPQGSTDNPQQSNTFIGQHNDETDAKIHEDVPMYDQQDREDQHQTPSVQAALDRSQSLSGPMSFEQARTLWSHHESATRTLSLTLTEHLRLILTPTRATKMRGDFRTGKRLNMKRIIPYIASQYKRDKIWMRRSVPSKRAYQIMLAIDDSSSMADSGGGQLALATVALISRALSMLEAGELAVVAFGEKVDVAHPFETPFAGDAGADVFRYFGFEQRMTDVRLLLQESLTLFRDARLRATGSDAELWQLQIVISDGVCDDHPGIRRLVRQAQEERIMIVFVIVDAVAEGRRQSIMDLQEADFGPDEKGEMKVKVRRYLDTFPFQYYLIVRNVDELPGVLAGALRQWFAEVVDTGV